MRTFLLPLCALWCAFLLPLAQGGTFLLNPYRFTAGAGGGFTPPDISGLVRWHKADTLSLADGDAVASWTDSSASAAHATQATSGSRPVFKTSVFGSMPGLLFDGSDDFLEGAAVSAAAAVTAFIVLKPSGADVSWVALGTYDTDEYWRTSFAGNDGYFGAFRFGRINNYPSSVIPNSGTHVFAIVSSGSTYQVYIDGVGAGAQAADFFAGTRLSIGALASGSRVFNGHIAEIIIYDSALSDTDRGTVETYLRSAARWNF